MLNYQSDIVKNVFIFDYFKNEKTEEIKIGFRFVFQSKIATLTASEIDVIYNEVINKSLDIQGHNDTRHVEKCMSITKKNIIKKINKETAISIEDATILMESFLLLVKKHAKSNKVKLSGFGAFCFKKTPKRIGKEP